MKKASSKKRTPARVSSDDISRKTVAVLLVIAVVLGVITTWVVSNRVQFKQEYVTPSTGEVSLKILPSANTPALKADPVEADVGVEILPTEQPVEEIVNESTEVLVE